ncbi:MAG: peptide-methionine (S)-S-oxide reductase MsrA [Rhodobacteraceae bacterium]|nr:peptide-methionine (S)-S-oxide reductase MsrA [Paracoccaceae bacterium]
MNLFSRARPAMPTKATALPGREEAIPTADTHFVSGRKLQGGAPEGAERVLLAMGCFWGAERLLWQVPGVWVTSVGYAGGFTPNPTYQETCTGQTGHTEVVEVVYEPAKLSFEALLKVFWENHDPTQGMRQGNDVGTQYRSAIYTTTPEQAALADASRDAYDRRLSEAGYDMVTTEIAPAGAYYMAEEYHQQYLAKNPQGYCGIGGTGVTCPTGVNA